MTTPSPNIAFHDLVDTLRSALVVLDSSLRVTSANQPFYRLFQVWLPQQRPVVIFPARLKTAFCSILGTVVTGTFPRFATVLRGS